MDLVANLLAMESSPDFTTAKALMKEEKFAEAVDKLSTFLEKLCETKEQLDPTLAPVYLIYGDACLSQGRYFIDYVA